MENPYIGKDQNRLNLSRTRVEKMIISITKGLIESTTELEMIREAEKIAEEEKWKKKK